MGRLRVLLIGLAIGLAASLSHSLAADYSKPGAFAVGVQTLKAPDASGNHPLSIAVW